MKGLRLFFATDIHGSDKCFMKFLNAAKFYRCQVLIMGGDMTGKMLVPIIDNGGGTWSTRLYGRTMQVTTDELPGLRKKIADAGFYGYDTNPDEIQELTETPGAVERMFTEKMTATLQQWLELAEERLAGTGTLCFVGPANDDPYFIDDVLHESSTVVNPNERLVQLPEGFTMLSVGYSNITPWDSPRELPEDKLRTVIDAQASQLGSFDRTIFNFHVPPKDTLLDQALLLDEELKPVMRGGQPVEAGVGSSAVRDSVRDYQPAVSLHGHIHESRGAVEIGKSTAINPGSEYSEGILRGVIVAVTARKGLTGYQFVSG